MFATNDCTVKLTVWENFGHPDWLRVAHSAYIEWNTFVFPPHSPSEICAKHFHIRRPLPDSLWIVASLEDQHVGWIAYITKNPVYRSLVTFNKTLQKLRTVTFIQAKLGDPKHRLFSAKRQQWIFQELISSAPTEFFGGNQLVLQFHRLSAVCFIEITLFNSICQ